MFSLIDRFLIGRSIDKIISCDELHVKIYVNVQSLHRASERQRTSANDVNASEAFARLSAENSIYEKSFCKYNLTHAQLCTNEHARAF